MKILLTGYSGLLGRHIAKALRSDGHYIRVILNRRSLRIAELREEVDEILWGDLGDDDMRRRALEGMDYVVHGAWRFSKQEDSRPTVNETMTKRLFELGAAEGIKRFAFLSSVAVYGMNRKEQVPLSESASLETRNASGFIYPIEKIELETWIGLQQSENCSIGIFRPGPIFDDRKHVFKLLIRRPKRSYAIGFGTGRNALPYIHAADVASAIALWFQSPVHQGIETFNLTPTNVSCTRSWYKAWGKLHDQHVVPVFVRPVFIRLAAWGAGILKRLLGKSGKVDVAYAIAAATRDQRYSNKLATTRLGWKDLETARIIHGG